MNRPLRLAECSHPISWVNATLSQTVRSRRGRFIVPAYTYTPTKWETEMRIRWNGYVYLMTWICVFDNVEMCVRWCECTYLVMRICIFDYVRIRARWIGPLRLTECSLRISRIVRWTFRVCSLGYRNPFAMFWQTVRSRRGRFIVPAYT